MQVWETLAFRFLHGFVIRGVEMSATLNYTYKYPFESALLEAKAEPTMRWATSLEGTSDDLFFDGKLRKPALVGQCLNVLTEIVRTRFYQQFDPKLLDPVVTSGGGMLRFEGFSSCCGVYAFGGIATSVVLTL